MEVDIFESLDNIIEEISTVDSTLNVNNKTSLYKQNESLDKDLFINNNIQETPELEIREVNASPAVLEDNDIQIIENNQKDLNDISFDQPVQSTDELKKIVLTQSQLKLLATTNSSNLRNVAIGCFVRVILPGLPSNYSDHIFVDQIVDILEPMSFQHVWIDRRYRLRFFGDFEIENIVSLQIQNQIDLRPWFDCMMAKDEPIPTLRFIRQKEAEIKSQLDEISLKQYSKEIGIQKPTITCSNLAQVTLHPSTMRSLAKLGFRRFRQVVMGCFVLMPAIRKNKPNDCQYHIVRVIDCIEGLDNYSLKDGTKINFQLVLPFYGRYKIKWMKSFSTLTEQGFNCFIDDMNSWCEKLPTLDELQNKAAELQLALTEAEHLPSMMDLENKIKVSEEKSNRAKRICSVKDLEPCFLTRERLQKLSKIEDSAVLVKILIGCFVRLTSSVSSETGFEKSKNDDIILELKFMGTISLTGLIRLVTTINPNEEEFKEWVRKNEGDEEDPLPLNKFVDEKSAELIKILGIPTENFKSNHQSLNHGNNSNVFTLSENFGKEGAGNNKSLLTNFNGVSQTTNEKLTAINFRKCLISMIKISEMISWDKEILARVIKGFFIAIGMKRPEKSSKHQFYIDQIIGVSWGGTPYRIRGNIKTNLRLHLKHLDIITLQDIYRPTGDGFSDDSLNIFIEDMKNWNQSLPSLNFIDSKNREYINAVSKYNNKFNSQSLFTRKDSREMSFLENNQQKFNATRNSPKLTTINPSYEQFQQYLQKQIVSSVRTTPGIGRNDLTVPKFTQQFPLSKSSTFNYFNTPISSEVNWEQQPTSSFSSTINKIKQLNNLRPEQEFWRHHNFISNDFEEVNDPYGSFSAINPSSYYSSPLTIEQEGLMSLSDHATANSSRLYQDMFVAENNFDSPISALQNRYSDTYLPSKRARFSPEAPPVDVFFD